MFWILFFVLMGVLGRLSGNGFGQRWGVSWMPELIHSLPYGLALGWAVHTLTGEFWASHGLTAVGTAISYAGMQSATWYFLKWVKDKTPNLERGGTMKPIIDFIAGRFDYKLGDEGYSWIAAGVKGFIIGLPVGGVLTALLWPLGYEIGSHARGRVERFGLDPHAVSEFMSAALGGVSVFAFVQIIQIIAG